MFPRTRLSRRNGQLNQLQPVQGSAQSAGTLPWNSWKAICFWIRIFTHPGKAHPGSHLPGNTSSHPSRAVGSWGSSALVFLPPNSPLSHLSTSSSALLLLTPSPSVPLPFPSSPSLLSPSPFSSSSFSSLFNFYFFDSTQRLARCSILVAQAGVELQPLAVKAGRPNHLATREFCLLPLSCLHPPV